MSKRPQATTDQVIKNAKPEAKPYKLSAGQGMFLLVNPTGSKLWRLKYRLDGKEKLLAFGAYPEVTLAQARLKRERARKQISEGKDPSELKKQQRQQSKVEALTFRVIAERWYRGNTELAEKTWAIGTAKKVRLYLEKDIYPAIGKKPLVDITRIDLINLNENMEKRGAFEPAAKVRRWLAAILGEAFDRGEVSQNVALNLKPSIHSSGVISTHHSFIPFTELGRLLDTIQTANTHTLVKSAINLLALTAVRPSELRLAEWPEFDLDNRLWHIPAERMKMRKGHTVPLTDQALELLKQVKAINPDGYLFKLSHKPFSENTIQQALNRAGYKGRQTGHGFRHLLSTELNERGYNSDWIETQLAHRSENKIRGVYNHAEYLEQRAKMMQEWANSIDALRAGAKVVAFGKEARA